MDTVGNECPLPDVYGRVVVQVAGIRCMPLRTSPPTWLRSIYFFRPDSLSSLSR